MDSLNTDLGQKAQDAKKVLRQASDETASMAGDAAAKASELAERGMAAATEQIDALKGKVDELRTRSKELLGDAENMIKSYPFAAVAIAAVAGLLVAGIVGLTTRAARA